MKLTLDELIERIRQYLSVGGFFNPESMEHDKVRDLIIDCRDYLQAIREAKGMPEEPGSVSIMRSYVAGHNFSDARVNHAFAEEYKVHLAYVDALRAHALHLAAENAAFIHDLEMLSIDKGQLKESLASAEVENERLRADAERYRWLRNGCNEKESTASRIVVNNYGFEWDAAIDSAMRAELEGGK